MRTTDREKKAIAALARFNSHQAAISDTYPTGTCFVCGDQDDVAWYVRPEIRVETILCDFCRQTQTAMFGTVFQKVEDQ